jgi:hypothetical protein
VICLAELTKEMIIKGKEFRKEIPVSIYGGLTVTIRPLTDLELSKIFKDLEAEGIDTSDKASVSKNYSLMVEACKYGIVNEGLHEKIKVREYNDDFKRVVEVEREVLEFLIGNAAVEIGTKIIEISTSSSEELKDFFKTQLAMS